MKSYIESQDALLLVTSVPTKRRNMLRLTAKATQFGHKTFTSWLIESAGTVPIQRRKDSAEGTVDNTTVMLKLMETLELGDAVLLFPEGMSRFHPEIGSLKTGVARLVSDVLTRNSTNPEFQIALLPCSVTYMHRQHFRSDVLVTFHKPMMFSPKDNSELVNPIEYESIRRLTSQMHQTIRSGTFDSPSWELVRIGKLATRIYAPLGTHMSLGDYVRLTRTFAEEFKLCDAPSERLSSEYVDVVRCLRKDLKVYQDELSNLGIKDDRVRRPLSRPVILKRMAIRLPWGLFLLAISFPGLLLWSPIFVTTFIAVHEFKKTGPVFDTFDEIAQYKLTYGLAAFLLVYGFSLLVTLPFAFFTAFGVPVIMWLSLRWFEDAVAALRAFITLLRLLRLGKPTRLRLCEKRKDLYPRVMYLAVHLGLPENPEVYYASIGGTEKGRIKEGSWQGSAKYFSLRRRRKRDWNETLRLYDEMDYPNDEPYPISEI